MSDDLSQKQQSALAQLQRGASFQAASQAAGVTRMTLYRWVKSDPMFRAAYNTWEQERIESARARLVRASGKAVDTLVHSVEVDPKLALKVLEKLGVFNPRSAGPINLEHVRQQIELEMKPLEPPGNVVRRLADAVSQETEAPQLTAMPAVLVERNPAPQLVETKDLSQSDASKNEPQQSAATPEPQVTAPRSPDEITVASCPDWDDEGNEDDQG